MLFVCADQACGGGSGAGGDVLCITHHSHPPKGAGGLGLLGHDALNFLGKDTKMIPIDADSVEIVEGYGKSYSSVAFVRAKDWTNVTPPTLISGFYEVATIYSLLEKIKSLQKDLENLESELEDVRSQNNWNSLSDSEKDAMIKSATNI